jgi:hypothetical protein
LALIEPAKDKGFALDIPQSSAAKELVESVLKLCSWYLTTQEFAMNASTSFIRISIRFG